MQSLIITVPRQHFPLFLPLLSQGVAVPAPRGISIRVFLCKELPLSAAYVDSRLQTIFLNGKAVDDIDNAVIRDGDTLALSAAMPGLVGATFRRGGRYAAFREAVSFSLADKTGPDADGKSLPEASAGRICLKLFNLVASEMGPVIFDGGVYLAPDRFLSAIKKLPQELSDISCRLDNRSVSYPALLSALSEPSSEIFVRLRLE